MNQWIRRIAVCGAVLGLAAAGGWACTDDGGEKLTIEEYFAALDKIDEDTTVRIDAVFESIGEESDVNKVRDSFDEFPKAIADAAADVDDLNPPDEAENKHETIVKALKNVASAARDAADEGDDAKTSEEFFGVLENEAFTAANDAFTVVCRDLEKLASDNGIAVDLGCDDSEGDSSVAEQTIQDVAAAWNAKDIDAFAALFTDAGLNSAFGEGEDLSREEILSTLATDIGDGAIEIREISGESSDSGADVTVTWASGKVLEKKVFTVVQGGDAWKIDNEESLDVETPAGATVVSVDLSEFAFGLDTSKVTSSGTIVFEGHNVGTQPHHMVLAKIPADLDLDAALESEEDPPGVEDIGGGEPFGPGESGSIALAAPLEPGRYVMVCFMPDTTDAKETPHALKGMVKDFTVE